MTRPMIKPGRRPDQDTEKQQEIEETQTTAIVPRGMDEISKTTIVQLQESELAAAMNFAARYPRQIHRAMEAMVKMATISEEAAATMNFAVPRGGKLIEGPSIRFAEVVKQAWGHCDSDAYVIEVNREQMYVEARGVYVDYEMNVRSRSRVRRAIRDKFGECFSEDMINITSNAACAIAKRNAILEGIPRAAWMNAYEASRKRAAGTVEGLPKKREEVLRTFMRAGVGPDRVLKTLGLTSEAQINIEHISTLRGMWSNLQSGEATQDDLFPPIKVAIEEGEAKKKPKTLAELALNDDDYKQALEDTRDAARRAYHKGISDPLPGIQGDAKLVAAWEEMQAELKAAEPKEEDDGGKENNGDREEG